MCCNSILIHGPPSSGKNKLIQSVSNALEFQVQTMQWTRSWMDSFLNSHVSEKRLVVIDHLDLLFPIGTDIQTDRLTTLLRCFHYIKKQPDTRCVFIGIAVVENLVHPTVRKCFDEYLSIGVRCCFDYDKYFSCINPYRTLRSKKIDLSGVIVHQKSHGVRVLSERLSINEIERFKRW